MKDRMFVGNLPDPTAPTQADLDGMTEVLGFDGFGEVITATFVPDGSTPADLAAEWEAAAQVQKDRAAFEHNRADRRRLERENRRAIKLAKIQALTRGTR